MAVYGAYLLTMDNTDYSTLRNARRVVKPADGSETIRILIVADQPAMRKAIQMRLAAETDLLVIGEAPDGEAALDLAISLCPDIALVDVAMPHADGIAAARALHLIYPQASIIILSFQDDPLTRALAADAGAAAFVAKSMPADALLATVRQVSRARIGRGTGERGAMRGVK